MDKEIINQRVRRLRAVLKSERLNGMLVTSIENIRYLTGFSGHDSWVLVLPRSVTLITDSRYTEQAVGECPACRIIERKKSIVDTLAGLLAKQSGVKKLAVEDILSIALGGRLTQTLRKLKISLAPTASLVGQLRTIKEAGEVRLIRRAASIAWDALHTAIIKLKPGITEQALAAILEYEMKVRGASVGFDTIVCFGPNGSRNHHQPGPRRLRKNDTILIDFGAAVGGYTCDITRSFAFGKPTAEYRHAWQAVYDAQQAAIAKVCEGVHGTEVDAAAREIIKASGFPVYGHGTGHGLGLQIHEAPYLSALDTKTQLKTGQTITIEPGIYIPGKFGIRIEDDILVTPTGCRILTQDKKYKFSRDGLICL